MLRISLFCFSLFIFNALRAQDFSNKGKDFWIAYGNHVRMFNSGDPEKMQIYITSDVNTTGTITNAAANINFSFTVTANQITTVDIPRTVALLDEGQYNYGLHLQAKNPVVVYSFIYVNSISGATLCLPTSTLGKNYFSINYTQVSNELNSYSYFDVVATDTGITTVEIIPTENTKGGRLAGQPFAVTLTQGQVYQVLAPNDLTGSSIKSISNGSSCKRIAVFCGSGKISIGCNSTGTSDNLYQQMYPTSTWGRTYVTVPTINNPTQQSQNNFYRIFKSDPQTQVKVNGSLVNPGVFVNNQYADIPPSREPNYIESDKPILVAQYFSTQGCAGNNSGQGDPEMVYLNPLEQTLSKVTLNSMQPSSNSVINQHFINVVLRNDPQITGSFTIDGQQAGNFKPLAGNPFYAYAQIAVTRGTHNLSADSGFNAIAYGFGNAESYGYSAGANLKDLYQFVSIQNDYATVNFPAGCRNSPFKFSMTFPYKPVKIKWNFRGIFKDTTESNPIYDSSWVVNGKTLYRYTLDKSYIIPQIGTYPILVIADNPTSDGCSGEQEINYDLQIYERPLANFNFNNPGCLNDSVKFFDVSDGNGRQVIRWNWDLGDGKSNKPSPVHKYSDSGTYTVRFSSITDIGCISDTISKTVSLTQQPFAKFTFLDPVCSNQELAFNDQSVPVGKIKAWSWDFGDGMVSSKPSPVHTFTSAKSYKVKFLVETITGCKSDSLFVDLPVHPLPKTDFGMPEICLNDAFASFGDSSSIEDHSESGFLYLWNFGDANAAPGNPNISAIKNPQHKYSAVGIYDVKLRVTSSYGCTMDTTKKFTVNGSIPKADFEVVTPDRLCSNKEVAISDRSTVDFGNVTRVEIYWDYANNPVVKSIDESPAFGKSYLHQYPAFGTPSTRTFQVLYIAYSGITCISQVTKEVSLMASPEIQFDAMAPVCEESPSFQVKGASEIFNFNGAGFYSGPGITASGILTPKQARPGTRTIRFTFEADNGCSTFKDQSILIYPSPYANAGIDRYLLEGESLTINATAEPGSEYTWLPETAIEDNKVINPKVSPTDDQAYRLQVKSTDGCFGSDEMVVRVLKLIKVPNIFTPNGDGVNDTWRIEHLSSYPGATVEVFNRYGQRVYFSVGYNREWDGKTNNEPLPIGTYYWLIDPKNGRKQMNGSITIVR